MTLHAQSHFVRRGSNRSSVPAPRKFGDWVGLEQISTSELTAMYVACPAESLSDASADYVVKAVRPDLLLSRKVVAERLLRNEIEALERISHPNVIPVLDSQVDGDIFLVEPFLDGRTLEEWRQTVSPQPLPVYLWLIRQVCQGLDAVHSLGMVHGDIKPANIIISASGHVTIVDFGFTEAISDTIAPIPFRGTPAYCAPERLRQEAVISSASDMFSLGVMAYQMLSGVSPFPAGDIQQLKQQHATGEVTPLKSLLPFAPTGLSNVIQRLLANDPLRRPTCRELIPVLLALEIETFGQHIQPSLDRNRAA